MDFQFQGVKQRIIQKQMINGFDVILGEYDDLRGLGREIQDFLSKKRGYVAYIW